MNDNNSDHEDNNNNDKVEVNHNIDNNNNDNEEDEIQLQEDIEEYNDLMNNTINANEDISNDLEQSTTAKNNNTIATEEEEGVVLLEEKLPINIKIAQILVNNIIPWVQVDDSDIAYRNIIYML